MHVIAHCKRLLRDLNYLWNTFNLFDSINPYIWVVVKAIKKWVTASFTFMRIDYAPRSLFLLVCRFLCEYIK
jgi:hypothetical protein